MKKFAVVLFLPVVTFLAAYALLILLGFANDPRQDYCPIAWVKLKPTGNSLQQNTSVIGERYVYKSGHIEEPQLPIRLVIDFFCQLNPQTLEVDGTTLGFQF